MPTGKEITEAKRASLREHGAMNQRHKSVADELFGDYDFFDPYDLVQVKYEMLRRVHQDGWPIQQAARTFGFSRVAFYRIRAVFQQEGLAGLLRHRPGPKHPHKLSQEVMEFLRVSRAGQPGLHAKELAQMLTKRFGVSIHYRTIERALAGGKKKRP